ncbi:unnamed protein product [Didymodactylos carnosus]|uniref:Uncharacterized protein n=2 Tax=Didymodactylos carnosus TaxID=1234261 RepID=A0A8S2EMT1_9BILA|nr:unnamed protein product [Didymodactylos carnosus]CAF4022633.1 unnamed protein product [Didymodactylos carnosus]
MFERAHRQKSTLEVNSAMVSYLIEMYRQYDQQKLPYQEKIRILSLLPEDWTYNEIQEKFGCTRHAVNLAKDLRLSTTTPLHLEPQKCVIRSRISPALTEHFITWLVETEMLVSIP